MRKKELAAIELRASKRKIEQEKIEKDCIEKGKLLKERRKMFEQNSPQVLVLQQLNVRKFVNW